MGLIGLIRSQKRQPPKGEALKRSTDIPRYIMCDAPALYEIGQGRHTTYYTVRASAPEVGIQASRGAKATLWGRQHVRCLQRRP